MQAQAAVDLAFFSFLYILSAARVRPLLLSLTFAERRNPIIHGLISPTFAQIFAAVVLKLTMEGGAPLDPRQHSHHPSYHSRVP
ncbi:uncharacterized protein BO87DRAFT_371951 [Aspergillus neoniger CBS 115656]|uniref:Uncharacterized protein n=1 Tax=Aspergillus neoniger (strain CBS 115656) TaxID=1448310 RepID=A0A318Z825_ASPNB|nr:hypothetical protein BO87DRAFT_371951 [Aspergillus neoniger CBS 115656]PYH39810.1 hypothetical protein BO87DRAFT_371951 [Aspergillus neoniger CBS 115656]